MAKHCLQNLDQRRVSISIPVQGQRTVVKGQATYCRDSELGPCLRIDIEDPASPVELVLHEGTWLDRVIFTGEAGDFLILPEPDTKIAESPTAACCCSTNRDSA